MEHQAFDQSQAKVWRRSWPVTSADYVIGAGSALLERTDEQTEQKRQIVSDVPSPESAWILKHSECPFHTKRLNQFWSPRNHTTGHFE
jgi:transposase-like protein